MEICNWDQDKSRLRCATEIEMEMCNWDWDASRWGCTSEIEIHWDGDAQQRSRWKYTTEIEVHHDRESQLIWRCIKMDTQKYDADALRWRCATEIKTRNWDQDAQLRCIKMEMCNWDWVFTEMRMHNWDRDGDAQLRCRWRCATEIEMHQDGVTQMRWRCIKMEMHKLRSRCIKIKMRNWDQDGNVQLRDSDAAPMVAVATNCNCSPTRKVIALVNSLKCHS